MPISVCEHSRPAFAFRPAAYHNITVIDAMPAEALSDTTTERSVYRSIEYRLLPGTKAKAAKLSGIAGACRFVWNTILGDLKKEYERGTKASLSFFSLGKRFTKLRRETAWLNEYSFKIVRYTLKYQADAWTAGFSKNNGFPKFKSKLGCTASFTLPDVVKIKNGRLYIPKVGYLTIRGGNPYPDGIPVKAVIKQKCGKWYATVCYKVEAPELPDNNVSVGIDRNAGQYAYTTTTGEQGFLHQADTKRKEAKRKRYQRKQARQLKGSNRRKKTIWKIRKAHKQIANARKNANHHASKAIAAKASTVYIEDLKTKNMTKSAKGTAEASGKNVKAKAGLNRVILGTGWGQCEQILGYKCRQVIKVPAAYTSQRCSKCGHIEKANRKRQEEFKCIACGYAVNADYNASVNILALGIGATARGRGGSLETPMIRENATECHSRI